ncbi:MAG: hypothetical protein Q8R76_06110 [Candidatus Omnitrophota bacterium]|nr:hypothetical protein [Candidatus Omnitrophota bacterium]
MNKIFSIFLAGLLLSFAWPLRGQFGHEHGAMIPGAAAAVITAVFMAGDKWRSCFAQAVIFGSLGFSIGGTFSYGSQVADIAAASDFGDVIPQLIHVFVTGAVWGWLGMLFLGFASAEREITFRDTLVLTIVGGGAWLATAVFNAGPALAWTAGGAALLQAYNALWKRSRTVTLFSAFGFFGFGLGFLISALVLHYGAHGVLPGGWWRLRDQIWGFIGGISVLLAARFTAARGLMPAPLGGVAIRRAGFITLASLVTGVNVWNVYGKWFKTTPTVPEPFWPTVYLVVCAVTLAAIAFYFLTSAPEMFSGEGLTRTLRGSTLFFCWFLAVLAILKSVVYSGWDVWEPAFALLFIDCVILTVAIPWILKKNTVSLPEVPG